MRTLSVHFTVYTLYLCSLWEQPCFGLTMQFLSGKRIRPSSNQGSQRKLEPIGLQKKPSLMQKTNDRTIDNTLDECGCKSSFGMSIALFTTYFAVISAKCALPSTFALLTSPTSGLTFAAGSNIASEASQITSQIAQRSMARLLTMSTFAIALGKFFLGPAIDFLGGIRSLQISLFMLSILLALISITSSFQIFSIAWLFVDFIFSSCWAASINAVHQSFPPNIWSSKVAMLASAARSGNAFAFAAFAMILESKQIKKSMSYIFPMFFGQSMRSRQVYDPSWRTIFFVSSLLQLVPLMLLSIFSKTNSSNHEILIKEKKAKTFDNAGKKKTAVASVKREAKTPLFWLHLISRTALMIFGSFLLFVPTFMTHCFNMTKSQSAQVGSIFACGCLLSLIFGSSQYSNLNSKKAKFSSITGLLATSTACAICQWLHVSPLFPMFSLSPQLGTFTMFLWGFSFAIPFYLPPSLYALRKGGENSSATIADVFDVGGFSLLALFNGYVAGIPHNVPREWSVTFLVLSLCSFISMASLGTAIAIDE